MSNVFDSNNFGLKLYNKFPIKYREDDINERYALKRYLEALADGGFKYSIDDINGITSLIDPDTVPSEALPILFKQYGLEVFNGIPETYLRYLLPKLGEAWSKKGSLSIAEFITSSLSGIKTNTTISYDSQDNPTIDVRLEMDYNIGSYFPDVEQFKRLLTNFIPFYCDVNLINSYMFYEEQVITGKHSEVFNINDIKSEVGNFKKDVDTHKDTFVSKVAESGTMQMSDENSNLNSTLNVLNSSFFLNGISCYDVIRYIN